MIRGNIPEKITYIYSSPDTRTFGWDDFTSEYYKEDTVIPCFPSDASNKKTLETGKNWADNRGTFQNDWDRDAREYKTIVEYETKKKTFDNIPTEYKIIALEHRGNGGRAYKVVDRENFEFDLREDVLFDVMMQSEIKNGELKAKLLWGKVGSQMKLVRDGSELHEQLMVSTKANKKRKIKKSEFKLGHAYSTKTGDRMYYLGEFDTESIEFDYPRETRVLRGMSRYGGHSIRPGTDYSDIRVKSRRTDTKKMLFCKAEYSDLDSDVDTILKHLTDPDWVCGYHTFEFKKSFAPVMEYDESFEVPDNIVDLIKRLTDNKIKADLESYHKHSSRTRESEITNLVDDMQIYSELANLAHTGEQIIISERYQKLMNAQRAI